MSQKEVLDALAALEGDEIQVYFIGQRLADEPLKNWLLTCPYKTGTSDVGH